jgi:hypothetical protein
LRGRGIEDCLIRRPLRRGDALVGLMELATGHRIIAADGNGAVRKVDDPPLLAGGAD